MIRGFNINLTGDSHFRKLSRDARLLYFILYMMRGLWFGGLLRVSKELLLIDFRGTASELDSALNELITGGFIYADFEEEVVWIPGAKLAGLKTSPKHWREHLKSFRGHPIAVAAQRVFGDSAVRVNPTRPKIPPGQRFRILKKSNFACAYCGRKPPDVTLQIDHVIPVQAGGKTKDENLVAACFDCNSGKSDLGLAGDQ